MTHIISRAKQICTQTSDGVYALGATFDDYQTISEGVADATGSGSEGETFEAIIQYKDASFSTSWTRVLLQIDSGNLVRVATQRTKEQGQAATHADLLFDQSKELIVYGTSSEGALRSALSFTTDIQEAEVMGGEQYGGWVLKTTMRSWSANATYNFLSGTENRLTVRTKTPGFDSSGAAITRVRSIPATVLVRRPYPNETDARVETAGNDSTVYIALSEPVYDIESVSIDVKNNWSTNESLTQAVSGTYENVINNSSLSVDKPIMKWASAPFRLLGAVSDVEAVVAHGHGQNFEMVAAVKFTYVGETSGHTVSDIVSQSVVSPDADENAVQVYRSAANLGGFTQGETLTVTCSAYPFIGNAASVNVTSDYNYENMQREGDQTHVCNKDGSFPRPLAVVNASSGNNGTGVVSLTKGTADASPFATIQGAAAAIQTFNNTNYSKNNPEAGIIYLNQATHNEFGASLAGINKGRVWLQVTRDTGATKSGTILGGTTTSHTSCDLLRISGITVQQTSGSTIRFDGGDAVLESSLLIDDCEIDCGNQSAPLIYRVSFVYLVRCNVFDAPNQIRPYSTVAGNYRLVRGCTFDNTLNAIIAHTVIGNTMEDVLCVEVPVYADKQVGLDGSIWAFNRNHSIAGPGYDGGNTADVHPIGRAIYCNVFEATSNIQPLIRLSADSVVNNLANFIFVMNTVVGQRLNAFYNDTGYGYKTKLFFRHNIVDLFNNKRDTFGNDGTYIGCWYASHGVSRDYNVIVEGSSAGPADNAPDADSWLGEYLGVGTVLDGSTHYANDSSGSDAGDNTGNGDYTLVEASPAKTIVPVGKSCLRFDIDGNARADVSSAGAHN